MFDGWINNGENYPKIIAVYNRKLSPLRDGISFIEQEVVASLLSASPIRIMSNEFEEENDASNETTEYNAEACIRQHESILKYFHKSVHDQTLF